jgi:PKD repeat protein|tara:strand:+ start:5949 stop:8354 length:2406 start_codon:yes stop_codon:yes gene_type:complete
MKNLVLVPLLLIITSLSFGQSTNSYDPGTAKEEINEWNRIHFKSDKPTVEKSNKNHRTASSSQIDRVRHTCHDEKFLLGANIAWKNFSYDLSLSNYDPSYFENMFIDAQAQGSNSMRFWLHTNGGKNPEFKNASDPLECTGIASSDTTNLKNLLDRAWNHGIAIQICLWTHNMLSTVQTEVTQAVRNRNRAILEDPVYTQFYIDNALIPVLKATKNHPALLAYEVFNEPEGMSFGVPHNPTLGNWPNFEHTNFENIQRTINLIAGAIHREAPKALVTNGALDMESTTIVDGNVNYYCNDSLINRGGDLDGYLDFYTVHYYDWGGLKHSPFHHTVDYWQLDKPLVIAEFYAEETFTVPADSLFKKLYDYGYAGAWGWQYYYNGSKDFWGNMKAGMKETHNLYSSEIDWDNKVCTDLNAVFNVDKKNTCSGANVVFTDLSTNSPSNWQWNFGTDASPANASTKGPHTVSYTSPGKKTVSLAISKESNADTTTLVDYLTVNVGHSLALTVSDNQNCDGSNLIFNSTISPSLLSLPLLESVPTGAWGENVTTIQSYTIASDSSTTPSLSNLSRFLHGTSKPTYGTYVEFTGNFSSTSIASIHTKSSSGSQNLEIQIDSISQGVFPVTGANIHSVTVPAGQHTLKFIGVGNDWIEVDKYTFTDVAQTAAYEWLLNGTLLTGEISNTFTSALLIDSDSISVNASNNEFNCSVPTISSNGIKMNCIVTAARSIENTNLFQVFPNPSTGTFTLKRYRNSTVYVYRLTGQLLETNTTNKEKAYTFGQNYLKGVYLLVDKVEGKAIKLIKQ